MRNSPFLAVATHLGVSGLHCLAIGIDSDLGLVFILIVLLGVSKSAVGLSFNRTLEAENALWLLLALHLKVLVSRKI